MVMATQKKKSASKKQESKQNSPINANLIGWIIVTVVIIVMLIGGADDTLNWAAIILLSINLIVFLARGTRWVMIITGIVLGIAFLGDTTNISPTDICHRVYHENCTEAEATTNKQFLEMSQRAIARNTRVTIYMFASSAYFFFSKEVKEWFNRKNAKK